MSFFDITVFSVPLYELIFTFFFYSICGYIAEVFYAALVLGKFVNRGFLAGPYCPIYGLAVACVDMLLSNLSAHPALIFLCGTAVIDTIEYFGGLILFRLFHQRWWDYTEEPFNVGGYICLSFSLVWGFFSMVVIYILIPFTRLILGFLPHIVIAVFCAGIAAYMAADIAVTVLTINKFNKKLEQIDRITNLLRKNSDRIGRTVSDRTLAAAEAIDLKGKKEELDRFIDTIPDPRDAGVRETAEAIRDGIKEELNDRYLPDARKRLDETISRLTSGERRILTNLPDSARSVYRETLAKLRDITGTVDISAVKKKLTSLFSSENGILHFSILPGKTESLIKLMWIFTCGMTGGLIREYITAGAGGYPVRVSLPLSLLYGLSAAALSMALWKFRSLRFKGDAAVFLASALFGAVLQSLCGKMIGVLSPGTEYIRCTPFSAEAILTSLVFGLIGIVWIKFLLPRLIYMTEKNMRKSKTAAAIIPICAVAAVLAAGAVFMRGL